MRKSFLAAAGTGIAGLVAALVLTGGGSAPRVTADTPSPTPPPCYAYCGAQTSPPPTDPWGNGQPNPPVPYPAQFSNFGPSAASPIQSNPANGGRP